MKNFQKSIGIMAVLSLIVMTSLLTAGCATGFKAIAKYQNESVPREEHARLFIGAYIQVIGINGSMSPLKYIASGGNVILLAPGNNTINVNIFDGNRDQPPYPGEELSFTAEAGKIYVVSTDYSRMSRVVGFFVRGLGDIPEEEGFPKKGFVGDKETFITQVEEAVAKL